jgi:hypothetical protein
MIGKLRASCTRIFKTHGIETKVVVDRFVYYSLFFGAALGADVRSAVCVGCASDSESGRPQAAAHTISITRAYKKKKKKLMI